MDSGAWLRTVLIFLSFGACLAVWRYYGTYTIYGTGDTFLQTFHAHGGPNQAHRKWHIECMDGEAAVGVGDAVDDFQKFAMVWCKFMFPLKPPTNGLYPYYPACFVQNMTYQFHCYNPKFHDATIHTFITAFWDNDFQFWVFRDPPDWIAPYKCCKTPAGYYIDYSSCYYFPTYDMYGEYYDNNNMVMVTCATGFVMTGIGKKRDVWQNEFHIGFIQCCRVGYGPIISYRPPKHSYSYDYYANSSYPGKPTGAYAAQYQGRNLGVQSMPRGFVDDSKIYSPVSASLGGPMFPGKMDHLSESQEDLDAHY